MAIKTIVIPIIYGVSIVFILGWILYIMYWILNHFKILDLLKRKPKIPKEIYQYVAREITRGNGLKEIAQFITKFDKNKQVQYINAYYELIQVKGGRKT